LKEKVDVVPKTERTFIPLSMFTYNEIGERGIYFRYKRYFAGNFKMAFCFDDVINLTIEAIVKSCPINDDNVNSVVLNLDKSRQFVFLKDKKSV
jgi:hypothetical protein